jgi:L,D-transpeptidase ErfK/SrfK
VVSLISMKTGAIIIVVLCFAVLAPTLAGAEPYSYGKDRTLIGSVDIYAVKEGESLIEIARHFDLGFNGIADANPDIDAFVPGAGVSVTIPSSWVLPDVEPRSGIVINLSEMRLFFFFDQGKSKMVKTYPIGIGDEGTDTPVGTFKVIQKTVNPWWHVPESIRKEKPELPRAVPPGPENPLGSHALRLSLGSVLIHGTNKPYGVGRRVSHGCIRLYPEDIPKLYDIVPNGARVTVVRQPVKVGVRDGKIYIEVHRDEHMKGFNYFNETVRVLTRKGLLNGVQMEKVYRAIEKKSGIPQDISPGGDILPEDENLLDDDLLLEEKGV